MLVQCSLKTSSRKRACSPVSLVASRISRCTLISLLAGEPRERLALESAHATRPADARRGCHVFAQGVAVPGDSESGAICDDGRGVGVLVTVGVQSSSIGMNGVDAGVFESRASARLDHRDGVTA